MSPIHLTFFITLAFLATNARAATDKAERMATDASVSTYERKAVINFAQVWIEDARVELPVTRCTIRKKKVEKEVENDDGEKETKVEVKKTKKCTSGGTWRAEMTEGWVQRNAAQHANVLVTPRFDQILVGPSQLRLITPTSDSAADIDLFTYRPNYEVGNYRSFKREMLKSLNLLAPALREAQTVINSARYQELPDQEKGTFMAEQAKSAGIPLSVFERLSASTYAFAIYIPRVTGSIEVTKTIDTDKSVSHSISVDAPLDTKIIVFRFEGDSFSIDLERRYGRGFGGALGRQMAGSASTSTAFEPTRRDAQSLFQAAFNRSLSDSYIDLGNALKADRRFALQAPLGLGPDGFTFPLGVKDGIRARHPFRIYRTIDGKEKAVGRVRVNSVLNNCTEAKPSVLTRRGGSIEEFDLAVEEPYGGPSGVSAVGQRSCRMQLTSQEYALEPTSLATSRTFKTVPQPTTGICTSIQVSQDSADKMGAQISLPVRKQPLALNDVITYPIRQSTSDWSHGSAFNTSSKIATMMKSIAKHGLSLQMVSPHSGSTLAWE